MELDVIIKSKECKLIFFGNKKFGKIYELTPNQAKLLSKTGNFYNNWEIITKKKLYNFHIPLLLEKEINNLHEDDNILFIDVPGKSEINDQFLLLINRMTDWDVRFPYSIITLYTKDNQPYQVLTDFPSWDVMKQMSIDYDLNLVELIHEPSKRWEVISNIQTYYNLQDIFAKDPYIKFYESSSFSSLDDFFQRMVLPIINKKENLNFKCIKTIIEEKEELWEKLNSIDNEQLVVLNLNQLEQPLSINEKKCISYTEGAIKHKIGLLIPYLKED